MHIHALRVTAEIPLSKLLKAGPQSPGWQRCSSTYLDGWKGSNENWWWRARARLVGSAIMFDHFPPVLAKIPSGVFSMGITRDTTFLSLLHLETAFLWIILLQLFFLHSWRKKNQILFCFSRRLFYDNLWAMSEINGFQQNVAPGGWHSIAAPFPPFSVPRDLFPSLGTVLHFALCCCAVCADGYMHWQNDLCALSICTLYSFVGAFLPPIAVLLMLSALCFGMQFEFGHLQFALHCFFGFPPLACNWNSINLPFTCQAPCWQFVPLQPQLTILFLCKIWWSCSFIQQN